MTPEELMMQQEMMMKAAPAISGGMLIIIALVYAYFAFCLQTIAKKTAIPNGWLAWIPIANIFLIIMVAKKPVWWFVLLLIPFVNLIVSIVLWMKIAENRGKPSWMGLLIIVPFANLILPGYLAFSK